MNLLEFAAQEAARQGIDPSLVARVLQTESGGNPASISPKGARGPMQLMPGTARDLGVNIDDPMDNIRGGVRYLAQQLKAFGTPDLALAAYNAGPGNVRKYGGVPPFAETQNYVGKIMGANTGRNAPGDDSDIFGSPSPSKGKAADDSDIFAMPKQPPQAVAAPAAKPAQGPLSLLDRIKDSPVGGFARGARDVIDGGAQLLSRGAEAVAPAGSAFEQWAQNERQNVERINQAAEQDYQQNWRRGQNTGLDGGRIAGDIVASLPIAAAVPGAGAATMLPRVGAGIGAGAIGGAVQPVGMEGRQDGDFWGAKAGQTAIGGVTGAFSPFVANALGKVASGVVNKARSVASRAAGTAPTDAAITQTVTGELAGRGVDFSKLAKETQDALLADAKQAMSAGGKLNFDALARRADFEATGIKPTMGQLTRDPMQFQFEQNTRGITGAGEGLSQRFNEQNAQLIAAINKARSGAQGVGLDRFGAADRVISSLRDLDFARKSGVDQLYSAAREQAGIHTPLNTPRFAQSVNDALDQAMVGDALPGGVKTALNQIAQGEMPFTIQKAEQIRQAINGQMGGIPSRENFALRLVNNALQDEIDRVGSAAGQQAGDAFKAARAAAADRFSALDTSAPLKAAVDGAAPDDFMRKFVISGKAGDLLSLRADLSQRQPQLWGEVRGQVVDWLKERALNGATDEFGKFSQSAYNKAVNQIGDAKLKVLFSPQEIAQLKQVGRVASAIQVQPAGSAVNNSGTSQAVANLVSRASNVPYLKEMVINPARNFVVQGKVNAALNPSAGPMFQPGVQSAYPASEMARRLQLPLSVGGYPAIKGLLE